MHQFRITVASKIGNFLIKVLTQDFTLLYLKESSDFVEQKGRSVPCYCMSRIISIHTKYDL